MPKITIGNIGKAFSGTCKSCCSSITFRRICGETGVKYVTIVCPHCGCDIVDLKRDRERDK